MAACLSPTLPRQAIHRRRCWTPKPSSSPSTATYNQRHRCRNIGTSSGAISARASPAAPVTQGLDADDFRHPLDKQNTLLLKAIPGLNDIGKALLGPVSEQVMVLQNIGSSVLVSENQLPELHQLMTEAAKILNTEAPDFYIRQNPVPNAYTLAINGKRPFVVVHTSLVELLTRKELQAVLAHELGHLKCDHGVWLTFANILTMGAYTVPGLGMVAGFLEEQLFRWLRAAELTCDRAALLVVQDPKVVISVLMKLAGGCPSLSDQLNVDAFLEQARSYDKASSNPVGWYIRNAQTRELSHPLPVMRAREMDEWSRSQEYRTLLQKMFRLSTLRCVVVDIEGTTTPISFVADVLFPYARANARAHLAATYHTQQTREDVALLRAQIDEDLAEGVTGAVALPPPDDIDQDKTIDGLVANVQAMIDADRKLTALKQLQGRVWRRGFESGEIKGEVYDDVVQALAEWDANGIKSYIYSSGSREAQRLIFGNTAAHGDLRRYLSAFFDTNVGGKKESRSYYEIWQTLGVDSPSQILFLTDVYQEATAARDAGLEVLISIRPGNAPLPEDHGFQTITSFAQIAT
ncbi:uncharacterized protein LOC125542715 [Triticum urartu]|nr:uncharacterized protein LOC125542715 [Triticum urartu]